LVVVRELLICSTGKTCFLTIQHSCGNEEWMGGERNKIPVGRGVVDVEKK